MMIDIEVTIVHPHSPSAARRHLDQLLTQARKSNDVVCDQLLEVRQAEIAGASKIKMTANCCGAWPVSIARNAKSAELARAIAARPRSSSPLA
jgi:hypothetical protein